MKKGREVDKKSRTRNLKGLSIFDDEIAAPADYGDFMKIDAPVALRISTVEEKIIPEVAQAPHWEKFIGNDGPPLISEAKLEQKIEVHNVIIEPVIENNIPKVLEVFAPVSPVIEQEVVVEEKLAQIVEAEELAPLIVQSFNPVIETTHKLPTNQPVMIVSESEKQVKPTPINESVQKADVIELAKEPPKAKAVLPRIEQPRIQLKGTGYEKITLSYGFGSLVGVQRRIVLFIFEDCVRGGKAETTPLTTEHICQSLGLTYKTTRGSVWRLQQKSFLEVAASKEGRGGWVIYRLNRDIYSELLLLKNSNQLSARDIGIGSIIPDLPPVVNQRIEPVLMEEDHGLANEWDEIDFSSLESIGFTKYHLKQLVIQKKNKLTPAEIQDSINFFSFDLKKNNKRAEITGEPLNYFMGIVRNGTPYVPPANYRSVEDEQRHQYLNYLKRKESERLEEEKKIKDFEFQNWKLTADLTEAIKTAPEYMRGKTGPMLDVYLDGYFEQNIWPKLISKFSNNSEERNQIANEIRKSLDHA